MNYSKLLSRAWKLVWNNYYLWILGMIPPALSFGLGLIQSSSGIGLAGQLFLLYATSIAVGGLISAVNEMSTEASLGHWSPGFWDAFGYWSPPGFWGALSLGWRKAPRLFAINLLSLISIAVMGLGMLALTAPILIPLLVAGITQGLSAQDIQVLVSQNMPAAGGLIEVALLFAGVMAVVCAVVGVIADLANYACVVDDLGVFQAYRRAWQMLRANFRSFMMWSLIFVAIVLVPALMTLRSISGYSSSTDGSASQPWLLTGLASTYFITLRTLIWRQWTHGAEATIPPESPRAVLLAHGGR